MRVAAALGGNALIHRGEPMTADNQRANARTAAIALADIAREGDLVVTHGNGPQVGLLALQSLAYTEVDPYPLDVLGAESEGMIGYMIEQELDDALAGAKPCVTLLTQVLVDLDDPAFANPTKFIGPVYTHEQADRLAAARGWVVKQDGEYWRRVVPSPQPKEILDIKVVRLLLDNGVVTICAGGGGIPVTYARSGDLVGVEAVIDKDRVGAMLAEQVNADLYLILTDAAAVYEGYGTPDQRAMRSCHPDALGGMTFAAGSMGPKVEAACQFARNTGKPAIIASLADAAAAVRGDAGTTVSNAFEGITYYESAARQGR